MNLKKVKLELETKIAEYCRERGRNEPDTNAFVFDSGYAEAYVEGLLDALDLIEAEFARHNTMYSNVQL